jgi:hypothetical protein
MYSIVSKKTGKGCIMQKKNIKNETRNSFFNLIKREDIEESTFVNWIDELQRDLPSFWEEMNE